jgi:hypothetical protein
MTYCSSFLVKMHFTEKSKIPFCNYYPEACTAAQMRAQLGPGVKERAQRVCTRTAHCLCEFFVTACKLFWCAEKEKDRVLFVL